MIHLLRHWKVALALSAVVFVFGYVHERDQRIRAQGRAEVFMQMADSLQMVADSFAVALDSIDAQAEDSIVRLENVIASIQENQPVAENRTDSTLVLLREQAPEDVLSLVDSLEVEIELERWDRERERNALYAALDVKDEQLFARDARIASLEAAMSARIQVAEAIQDTGTGFWEKAAWGVGGLAVGFLVGGVTF